MASGKPVDCFDIPGYRDVVEHGETGLQVSERSAAALADSLWQVLEDKRLARRLGERGRAQALTYSWPMIAKKIEAALDSACR